MSVYDNPWDDPSPCRKADEIDAEPPGGFGCGRLALLVRRARIRGLITVSRAAAILQIPLDEMEARDRQWFADLAAELEAAQREPRA